MPRRIEVLSSMGGPIQHQCDVPKVSEDSVHRQHSQTVCTHPMASPGCSGLPLRTPLWPRPAPMHPSVPVRPGPSGSHVRAVTSLALAPTFLRDDAAEEECVRREGGRERGEGVPCARSIDRQQGTAAALGSRRISLHCD